MSTDMSLNNQGHFANGVLSSAFATTVMQPVFVMKSFIMVGRGIPPVSKWYGGFGTNLLGVVPAQGAGFFGKAIADEATAGYENSPWTAMVTFLLPGLTSATPATFFERMMIVQQLDPQHPSLLSVVKRTWHDEGFRGFARGFFPTWGRDAIFLAGVFSFNDGMQSLFSFLPNPKTAEFLGSVSAGLASGFLSTPCDRVKTLMQGDSTYYRTVRKTVKSVYAEGGVQAFFKGALPRSLLVGGFIYLMGRAKEIVPYYLPTAMQN